MAPRGKYVPWRSVSISDKAAVRSDSTWHTTTTERERGGGAEKVRKGSERDLERGLTGAGTTVRGDGASGKKSTSRWFHLAALLAVRGRGQGQALDRAAGADAGRHDVLVELGRLKYIREERREGSVSAWWVV
jgi:hypothetical protein